MAPKGEQPGIEGAPDSRSPCQSRHLHVPGLTNFWKLEGLTRPAGSNRSFYMPGSGRAEACCDSLGFPEHVDRSSGSRAPFVSWTSQRRVGSVPPRIRAWARHCLPALRHLSCVQHGWTRAGFAHRASQVCCSCSQESCLPSWAASRSFSSPEDRSLGHMCSVWHAGLQESGGYQEGLNN